MKIFLNILFVILFPCVIYAKHAEPHFDVFTADMTPIGNSGVNGQVTIFIQKGKKIFGVGTASNLEANINDQTGNCTEGNGCGVHVHKGTGCGSKEEQGVHFFTGDTDPWSAVRYRKSDANGNAKFEFIVNNAATSINGKAFVIHNNAGGRVGCGILKKQQSVQIAHTKGINGAAVIGEVTLFNLPNNNVVVGSGVASKLEANINDQTGSCTAGNGCGVHIHKGTGCGSKDDQGGHYFIGTNDPWKTIRYHETDSNGDTSFVFSAQNSTATEGKPFIIHNNAGGRVSCGILKAMSHHECPMVKCAEEKKGCKRVVDDTKDKDGCLANPCGTDVCTDMKDDIVLITVLVIVGILICCVIGYFFSKTHLKMFHSKAKGGDGNDDDEGIWQTNPARKSNLERLEMANKI